MRILLVSQMYPGPAAPALGSFVATLEQALGAGEDYELLWTMPDGAAAPKGSIRIGRITRDDGIFLQGQPLEACGYDHLQQ